MNALRWRAGCGNAECRAGPLGLHARDHTRVIEFTGGWHANLFAFNPDLYYATMRSLLKG